MRDLDNSNGAVGKFISLISLIYYYLNLKMKRTNYIIIKIEIIISLSAELESNLSELEGYVS